MRMTLQQIGDTLHQSLPEFAPLSVEATGVSTDSRTISEGDLFVALKGESFDGHVFVEAAFDRGAIAAVVHSDSIAGLPSSRGILIGVPDTLAAYGTIARAWRRRFDVPVIAVTGSVGKTTTKEMIAAALSSLGSVLKTEKNENNEIGVPQLLLKMTHEYAAVVVEMGMRGTGQIAYLSEIAEPTVGVITRIAENHIELLGSMEAIALAKAELIGALPKTGLAVLNGDDPYTVLIESRGKCRMITHSAGGGPEGGATITAIDATRAGDGSAWTANLVYNGAAGATITINSPARHDLSNALAAVLVAVEVGVPLEIALQDVQHYANVGMRMDVITTESGATILSDCYNASPTSTISALETLAGFPGTGRKIAFLGDMKELGDNARSMHADVAKHAAEFHLSELFAVGPVFSDTLTGALRRFDLSSAAAEWVASEFRPATGDVVLVKGSRAMKMETIVEALTKAS